MWFVRRLLFLLLQVSLCWGGSEPYRREVHLDAVSGPNSSVSNLLHVRAVGYSDTIHYVWGTLGAPTVLLVYSNSSKSTLNVNWTKLFSPFPSGAVRIEPAESILYSTAIAFTKIFEYDDSNNTANFSGAPESAFYPAYNLADFVWGDVSKTLNTTALSAEFQGVNASDPAKHFQNGSVSFRVSAYKEGSRDLLPPHLLYTANCSKVEFVMAEVAPRGKKSRFVLEMVTLEKKNGQKRTDSVWSIDDEYTPTIFEMAQLISDVQNHSRAQGFLQWKAVAYGDPSSSRAEAVPCRYHQLHNVSETWPLPDLAVAFFGEDVREHYNVEALNVSFGVADGEFYEKHNYLIWSAVLGFGTPPRDSFSTLVIAIMAVALGMPAVLLIVGFITMCILKKKRYSEYEPIN
ncbi:glycosylated lysosomal membrane protein [Microcaecilia unicolor]|uniref:Glycosylated lysosomal membrane protein n=1 Tax=Microcaecilia unicolor TaxID=1415580 RepID=A0A6P7WUI9_9AMPH|nr:glycosylated lysosomal membrane protein [Microcaecilia unicolor]